MTVYASAYVKDNPPPCKPVKCPLCGRGRICDVATTSPVKIARIPIKSDPAIFVKCQCCGQLISIQI